MINYNFRFSVTLVNKKIDFSTNYIPIQNDTIIMPLNST